MTEGVMPIECKKARQLTEEMLREIRAVQTSIAALQKECVDVWGDFDGSCAHDHLEGVKQMLDVVVRELHDLTDHLESGVPGPYEESTEAEQDEQDAVTAEGM